jgi:hypothetical protein
MKNRACNFLLALMVSAAGAAAQDAAPTPAPAPGAGPDSPQAAAQTTDASSVVLAAKPKEYVAPTPPPDSDGVIRSVSAGVAAALSAGAPKYSPPTPTPTEAAVEQDMRDIDKPKNEIHRLPQYVVREARPPIFRNRDLFTTQGMLDLTLKNHAGLNFGNILGLNASPKPGSPAYQMMVDDERKENMDDLFDTAHAMAQGGDFAEGSYILQQSQSTYMRDGGDWDWSGSGPVGGLTGAGK